MKVTIGLVHEGEQHISRAIAKQITVASLWTEDVPATVRFYSKGIGLRLCSCQGYDMDPPHFDVGGAYLTIVNRITY